MSQIVCKESLGWTSFFEHEWSLLPLDHRTREEVPLFPARIVAEERSAYRLQSSPFDLFWGLITGRARRDGVHPAVGDWVACSRMEEQPDARIHHVLPRASCLMRRAAGRTEEAQILAANVDVGLVVMALGADFNPRRLERYLTTIYDGGARPVVLLTKLDLCIDVEPSLRDIERVAPGVEVLALSSVSGENMDRLDAHLTPGLTAVLLGSSGAGKTTLINRLHGEVMGPTQPVRDSDGRGRHTTTSRHLWILPSGAMLIDTPGLRELQLWAGGESLDETFDDLRLLARGCRFGDCRHHTEPGCAVRAALEEGSLALERVESYEKLRREMEFQARKQNKAMASRTKDRWKAIHKQARAHVKRRRWED